jgi:hypothetical protein
VEAGVAGPSLLHGPDDVEDTSWHERDGDEEEKKAKNADAGTEDLNKDAESGYPQMTEKQKKLFELRLKMVINPYNTVSCSRFN